MMYIYQNDSIAGLGNGGLGQPTPEDQAKQLIAELRPLFLKKFSKKRITYGPQVGKSVKFRVVADKDFKAEVEKEAKRLAEGILPMTLKFAPEIVLKELQKYYKAIQEPFPARLKIIDEKTQLTRDEKAAIFTLLKILTIKKATDDADKVGGFYSLTLQEMVFRESQIDAGIVAHEMAHAYADTGWYDFIRLMQLRGMDKTHELDEGMTTVIERIIIQEWFKKQPASATIPLSGYDAQFTDIAQEFIKALGQDRAFEVYFGGWVDFTSNAVPEDTLVMGRKAKMKWKWLWRVKPPSAPTPPRSAPPQSRPSPAPALRK